jgi:hypothetical protein
LTEGTGQEQSRNDKKTAGWQFFGFTYYRFAEIACMLCLSEAEYGGYCLAF